MSDGWHRSPSKRARSEARFGGRDSPGGGLYGALVRKVSVPRSEYALLSKSSPDLRWRGRS